MVVPLNLPVHEGRFSDDEFFDFCRLNPKVRVERDETGQIFIYMPTGLETSFYNSALNAEVYNWNRRAKGGRVSDSNGGYTLPDTSMRAPDVAWVSHERLATVPPHELKRFARVCPDFVIELASETDDVAQLQAKMEMYLRNGVRLGWLVDPFQRQTHVYRSSHPPALRSFNDVLTGEEVLVGFEVRLGELEG